jgi:hypothetical protein
MATITLGIYSYDIIKTDVGEYTLTSGGTIPVTGTIEQYSVNSSTGALTLTQTINVLATSQVDNIILEEGMSLLRFVGFNVTNRYWTVISNYQDLLDCLAKINENLLQSNLCNNCYPNFKQDANILLTSESYFVKLSYYLNNPVIYNGTTVSNISNLNNTDLLLAYKLFRAFSIYCSDCFSSTCKEC